MARPQGASTTRSQIWPCPLPYPDAVWPAPSGQRRRPSGHWALARRRLVNLAVAALDFIHGGCRRWLVPPLQRWRPLNDLQRAHVARVEELVGRWGRVEVNNLDIGHKGPELEHFVRAMQEHCRTLDHDLHRYSSSARRVVGVPDRGFLVPDPARLAFPDQLEGCVLEDHLEPYLYAAFLEPDTLCGGPPRQPTRARPRFRGQRADLLKIFEKWAVAGRFGTVRACRVPAGCAAQVAAVRKTEEEDRQILDERGQNSVEDRVGEGPSKHLPAGPLLLDMHLERSVRAVLGTKDRKHFYHQFGATPSRTARTAVGVPFRGRELAGLPGCDALEPDGLYYGCFAGLGMGDHAAVDFALGGHEQLLAEAKVLTESNWVRGDRALPGGPELVEVIIDDLVVVEKVRRDVRLEDLPADERPDVKLFDRAEAGYLAGRMPGAPAKDKIGHLTLTVGGLEVDGERGIGGTPRDRVLPLAYLSMVAGSLREITPEFADVLGGCWTSVFLSRRPLLVALDKIYHVTGPKRQDGVHFPRGAASELIVAAALGPLAVSDMRVPYSRDLYSTDASPSGGGVTVHRDCLSPEIADELWRHRDRRGGYSRLEAPAVELAQAYGVMDEVGPSFGSEDWSASKKQFLRGEGPAPPGLASRPLAQRWDILSVGGVDVDFPSYASMAGLAVGPVVSRKRREFYDILDDRFLEWLLFLVNARRVRCWLWCPSRRLEAPRAAGAAGPEQVARWHYVLRRAARLGDAVAVVLPKQGTSQIEASFTGTPWRRARAQYCRWGGPHNLHLDIIASNLELAELHRPCAGCGAVEAAHLGPRRGGTEGRAWWPAVAGSLLGAVREFLATTMAAPPEPPGFQTPWSNGASRGPGWSTLMQWTWQRESHINILEAAAERRLVRHLCREKVVGRVNVLEDSRVTILSGAKGRSSSRALKAQLGLSMPYQVGGGLYLGRHYTPSALMTADAPSRNRELPAPSADLPPWMGPDGEVEVLREWMRVPAGGESADGMGAYRAACVVAGPEIQVQRRW